MASVRGTAKPSARERLLAAADELFYAEGVQSVGIDRVIEHAGVAKASLYNTFGGKEQLVGLPRHPARGHRRPDHPGRRGVRHAARADAGGLRVPGTAVRPAGLRGCAFIRAGAEASPGGLVQEAADSFRGWMRELFTRLAAEAGAADPDALGHQLHILYDGAGISALMDHDSDVAAASRAAATALIAAATGAAAEA